MRKVKSPIIIKKTQFILTNKLKTDYPAAAIYDLKLWLMNFTIIIPVMQ